MSKQKTNVFITLDYELFMGNITGTVINCMIKPLDKLIEILNKHKIKITIFVDAAYLLRLSELKFNSQKLQQDYKLIVDQLKLLSIQGHDIQLHIHPQWLNATYFKNNWILDSTKYKLSDIEDSEVSKLFKESKELLEEIIGKPIIAFRAGGYSIQSYSKYIDLFINNGILVDSSVLGNAFMDSNYQKYDYRLCPSFERYNFSQDIIKENPNGNIIELPITQGKVNILYIIYKKLVISRKNNQNKYGDGIPLLSKSEKSYSFLKSLKKIFISKKYTASIDSYSSIYLSYLFNQHRLKSNDFVIIGHPKNFTDFSIFHLEKFILKKRNKIEFLTISSIAKKIHE
jgi:peptidoglycan/xylan/chitin deacetylase (PgdA/CDA1 family)